MLKRDVLRATGRLSVVARLLLVCVAIGLSAAPGAGAADAPLGPFAGVPGHQKSALVIGVGNYTKANSLRATVKDAEQVSHFLRTSWGFSNERVTLMTDNTPGLVPTGAAVREQISRLIDRAGPQEELIFYFSGHGTMLAGGDYLAPADADPDKLSETCISLTDLVRRLAARKPRRALLILDSQRTAADGAQAREIQLPPASGISILFSSQAGELSWEGKREHFPNGVFTHFLLEGLKGAKEAREGDGRLTFDSLARYVRAESEAYSQREFTSPQRPIGISASGSMTLVGSSTLAAPKDLLVTPLKGPLAGRQIYGKTHALLIGINRYPNLPDNFQLRFTRNDVEELREVLVSKYGFPAGNIRVLLDEQATSANIREALADLSDTKKVNPDDRVLVYFSGHGSTVKLPGRGEMGFLIPFDAKVDLTDLDNAGPFQRTCLRMDAIWGDLEASPAKHVLLLADACYSGLLAKSRSVENLSPSTLAALSQRRALQVVTAGGKGEKSWELGKYGHGAFTYKLLEELKARSAEPGDVFTASELFAALRRSVSNLTDGTQLPQYGDYNTEGDFLFITAPKPAQ